MPFVLESEILRAENISVYLSGAAVLRSVGLHLNSGEILGIFGPSGAGKSTLLKVLAGDGELNSGRVIFSGEEISRLPLWRRARKGIGYLPQTPSVLLDLSVRDNIEVFARLCVRNEKKGQPPSRKQIEETLLNWIQRLGLFDRMNIAAGLLSGGERRRLELVRALSGEPDVLLCDEPFAAVDPIGTEIISLVLKEAAQRGTAIVLCDHHLASALRLCDRAMLLLDGECALNAPADEFARHELVSIRYAGRSLS